jgi:hypothetical protein
MFPLSFFLNRRGKYEKISDVRYRSVKTIITSIHTEKPDMVCVNIIITSVVYSLTVLAWTDMHG